LELIPLTARQLRLWLDDVKGLESELRCAYRGEALDGFFGEIVRGQIAKTEQDEPDWLYHSFWLILRKSDRVVVGSCGFKNVPGVGREVEIGYGLAGEYEGAGYMTEAIKAFSAWALEQDGIHHVVAETEPGNVKSERVLERARFVRYEQGKTDWWRL
jgi:RimJ/RimL family protein N-acetyltransferase